MLLLLGVVLAVRLGVNAYRWAAYSEERTQLEAMRHRVADAGVDVVRTAAQADTLLRAIKRMDAELEAKRRTVDAYGRFAREGVLADHLYDAYRADLDEYNARVGERNAGLEGWNGILARNQDAVARYNSLADSIRALSARIGDPYYPIPLPVEAAVERGLLQPRE